MGEFELIARCFRPLTGGDPDAFDLENDAALYSPGAGQRIVTTLDTMVAGVHFLPSDPPGDIAKKLLRVNLSDLNAMGASPARYLLSLSLPEGLGEDWVAAFAQGLAEDQARYGLTLLGGDTTRTPGPLSLSLTAIGTLPERARPHGRTSAEAGDLVCVTGTLGDAAAGLLMLQGALSHPDRARFVDAYRLPEPPMAAGPALLGIASAALDISDGLLADLAHIAEGSGLEGVVRAPDVPLSGAFEDLVADDPDLLMLALAGGDDYQLLFTLPPDRLPVAMEAVGDFTVVGEMRKGKGVTALNAAGLPLEISTRGWTHF